MSTQYLLAALLSNDGIQNVQEDLEKLSETPGMIEKFISDMTPKVINFGINVLIAIVVYIIGAKIIKYARKLLRKTLDRCGAEHGIITFLDSCTKILLYFILVVSIASRFGLKTSSVVALVGSAGLALGLALQGSLANFAGGVLILVLRPFRVGDYIVEDSHGNEGKVQEISIFYTKLLTTDNKVVVIPNGTLTNSSLTNVTHQDERLLQVKVGISYQANIQEAKDVLAKVLMKEESRLPDKEIKIFVDELADSAVVMGCRLWVQADAYWDAKWRVTEQIKLALDEAGIEIPYQQIDIKLTQNIQK